MLRISWQSGLILRLAACVVGIAIVPAALLAATDTWKTAASGVFSVGGNWTDGSAPTSADGAKFDVAGSAYTVTFTADVTNQKLEINQGDITFNSSLGPWTYNLTASGGEKDALILGGTLTLGTSTHPLHLTAGTELRVDQGGTLNIKYASDVNTATLNVGTTSGTSLLLVDGSGSSLTSTNTAACTVGDGGGTGSLTLQNSAGGNLAGTLHLGDGAAANSVGHLTVQSGADLALTNIKAGTTGLAGQSGTILVTGSGSTITQGGTSYLTLGAASGSTGSIELASSGSLTTGTGMTTINRTGTFTLSGGTLNANGGITIDGGTLERTAGVFSWTAGQTMTVKNGGQFSWAGADYSLPSDATIAITGAGSKMETVTSGSVTVGNGSSISVQDGVLAVATGLRVGTSGGDGVVTVSGSGAALTVSGTGSNYLGQNGFKGTLNLLDSAMATIPGTLGVADSTVAGSEGALNVESNAALTVGNMKIGTGGVSGQSGAVVAHDSGSIMQTGASTLSVGAAANNVGTLTVDYSGVFTTGTGDTTIKKTGAIVIGVNTSNTGRFNANGNIILDGGLLKCAPSSTFTWAAGKTMTLSNGGKADLKTSFTVPDAAAISVTGTGSILSVSNYGGNLATLKLNNGQLGATGGGGITADMFWLNHGGSATPQTVTVDGSGSLLWVRSDTEASYIGGSGTSGTLILSNGANATVEGTLLVGASFGSTVCSGTINIQSGAYLHVGDLEVAAGAGTGAIGTINITGLGSNANQIGEYDLTVGSYVGTGAINITNQGYLSPGSGLTTVNRTGTLTVGAGGTLGSVEIQGDLLVDGGLIDVQSGSLSLSNAKTITLLNGGRIRTVSSVHSPTASVVSIDGVGSRLETLSNATLTIDDGTPVTVTGGGALASSGQMTIAQSGNASLTVDGPASNVTVSSASRSSWGTNGYAASVALRNHATGSIAGGVNLVGDSDSGTSGTLTVEGGAALSIGPLAINYWGGADTAAAVTVTGTGSAVTHTAGTGPAVGNTSGGPGLLRIADGATYTVPSGVTDLNPSGIIDLDGGTANLGTLHAHGGKISFSSGSLSFAGGLTIGAGGLWGDNVTLTAAHVLDLTGTSSATIDSGATLTVSGGQMICGTLTNSGTLNLAEGRLAVGGTLSNPSGGRLFVGGLAALDVAGATSNSGRLEFLGGGARLTGAASLTNSSLLLGDGEIAKGTTNAATGEIRADVGKRLLFSGASFTNSGQVTLVGGTVETTATFANSATAFIIGHGVIRAPSVANNGTVAVSSGDADFFGDFTNNPGAKVTVSGGKTLTFWDDVVHNGAPMKVAAGSAVVFFGNYSGAGLFTGTGTVYYEADLRPGSSPALITFGGSVTFADTARPVMEVGGPAPGTQHDRMEIAGHASLGGALDVALINGFRPRHNDRFEIMTWGSRAGTFSPVTGLDLGGRLALVPTYTATSLTLAAVQGGSGEWRVDAGGNASVPTNWTAGLPNGGGDTATFGPVIQAARQVTVDTPTTLGAILFDSTKAYTVAGPATVSLQAASSHASIGVTSASGAAHHVISAPLTLLSALDIDNASAGDLTFLGALNDAAGLAITKTGDGAVTFSGPLTFGAGSLLLASEGTVNLNADAGSALAATLSITVTDAVVNFGCDQHLDTLDIGSGGTVRFTGARVVVLNDLVMNGFDFGATIITPEPATIALLAFGGLGVMARRRRKHRFCHS